MSSLIDMSEIEAEEYCESVRDGTHDSPKFHDSGYPLITSKAIKEGSLIIENAGLVSEKDFTEINKRSKVDQWDILFTMIGTLGEVYLEKSDEINYAIKNVGLFKCGTEIKAKWLYYWFRNPDNKRAILQLRRGASQQYLPLGTLRSLKIRFPDDENYAQRVVDLISAYDDLIENNKRRIELLEESARQLYKEWFVRFRFPGHEHVKIIGGVPEGWCNGCVGDIAKVFSGYAFKSKNWLEEGNPVIKIRNITSNNTIDVSDCQYVDDNVAEKAAKFKLAAGDMLIAMTGATVGKVGLMPSSERTFYLNQRVGRFETKLDRDATPLLLSFFNSDKAQSSILNLAGGAAQPNISANQIESIEIPIPPATILNSYLDETDKLFSLRLNLIDQNFRLIQARDLLLPKLMSGEIAV